MWHSSRRPVAGHCVNGGPGEVSADLLVRLPAEKLAQRLVSDAISFESPQQTLDRRWHFAGRAAITDRPRDRCMAAESATDAEVIRVDKLVTGAHLLAFDADVRDPMLPAAVRAAGDVDFELLAVLGEPMIELLNEPAREALRLSDGQLAELRAGAGDSAAEERRGLRPQTSIVQLPRNRLGVLRGHVRNEQVLHDRRTQFARSETLGDVRGRPQLLRQDAPAQDGRANVDEPCLLLAVNADVVAIDVVRRQFGKGALEGERQPPLDRFQC